MANRCNSKRKNKLRWFLLKRLKLQMWKIRMR